MQSAESKQTRRVIASGWSRWLDRSLLEALRATNKTLNDVTHLLADVLAQSR